VTAAALHDAANPEKHPRLRLMLADLSEVLQCCEEQGNNCLELGNRWWEN
jgi:hypothetical protein